MAVIIKGYLTQQKLENALREIVGLNAWRGKESIVPGTRQRWDMTFVKNNQTIIVEYDGDEHYRNSLKIKTDIEKDKKAKQLGYKVIRIPYWVQLTTETFRFYFGFDAHIQQEFPHGFITTKIFPASFCEKGIKRFKKELHELPANVKTDVIKSLRDRARDHGIEYVLPETLRYLID